MSFPVNTDKITPKLAELHKKLYDKSSTDEQKKERDNAVDPCNKYFETDSYKNGETDTYGYTMCCNIFGMCGMSGWVIFLIIVLVLGLLAAGAAAFWFFYWKRKYGGQESNEENGDEDTTKDTVLEVSIDTY